ncbi:Phospholipase A2 inhibitor subunit gamma B [Varanus komodoensis]|nr:Phospholipase A2 inhibitor subunit gamma B [Varanus komodoensis]
MHVSLPRGSRTPGDAIFCHNCTSSTNYNCSTEQQKCGSSVNSCITIARDENTGSQDIENPTYEKKCNSDDRLCNQFYALVAGEFRMRWNSSCCRADRCNTKNIIVQKPSQVPNGVRCNSCFAQGSDVCLNKTEVACTGILTHCIHFATTAKKEEFKKEEVAFTGCATKNMCDMGAIALFAAGRNVNVKSNICSGATRASSQYPLALPVLVGSCLLAFWA